MTDLVIRKLPWTFDDTVPFQWQPANPMLGIFGNLFTFFAVPFEQYIINALRDAKDRVTDPKVAEEMEAFVRQEGQHSWAHRKHMNTLIKQYPGLKETQREVTDLFDSLLASRSTEFHVSYVANIEATFTPLFKVFLDHRDSIFGGGDPRIASLILWHFVEEIEHRSSGLIICDHLTRHRWSRSRYTFATAKHVMSVVEAIAHGFDRHVPATDRGGLSAHRTMTSGVVVTELKRRLRLRFVGPSRKVLPPSMFHDVPSRELVAMILRLIMSQAPYHNPADQPLPQWAAVWMAEYERGVDMTTFFDAPAKAAAPPDRD
ncbi:metal-dependent hydrolase [Mycobacterium lentiflavum]|uniref:Metal-dependent hydrolase n=1 Tax=Mycobacterium lentiflavum TaxID=141349 RepID=A0A0E4CPQ7_MYCLN|nr:metal-dependent hydrolase [Mycobacterium lentiflavum]CQD18487.1 metal-dependent hydrolase [Mycobacterium lentiflavum]